MYTTAVELIRSVDYDCMSARKKTHSAEFASCTQVTLCAKANVRSERAYYCNFHHFDMVMNDSDRHQGRRSEQNNQVFKNI